MARFFGFDLGDGESAVCFLASDANANVSPQAVRVFGENCFVSTYGLSKNNKVLLGEKAIKGAAPTSLHARFKRNYLNNSKETDEEIRTFAHAVHDDLEATGQDIDAEDVIVAVGCPSSWDEKTRSEYKSIFEDSGFKNVRVISESRAAFIFAKQAGLCSYQDLQKFVLIIDAGSSTMDLTIVDSFVPIDFGHPKLGAGLIEQELLRLNETREEKLHNVLTDYPAWRVRHELDARKLKEDYFDEEAQTKKNEPVETVQSIIITLDGSVAITCSQEDMTQILHTKFEELNGDTFLEAYGKCLQNVKELCLQENELGAIILTGGASRMSFIRAMAEEAFPGVRVIQGNDPELSIAQGLAYTLHIDDRIKNFRDAIDKLTKPGGEIETLIMGKKDENGEEVEKAKLGNLFDEIVEPVVDEMTENVIMPEFRRWKRHEINSFNDMEESIKTNAKLHFDGEGKAVIAPIVEKWLASLAKDIEELTNPICQAYGIPQDKFNFSLKPIRIPGENGGTKLNPSDFLLFQFVQDVVNFIISTMIFFITFSFVATGPIGVILGFIASFIAMFYAKKAVNDFLKSADLPSAVRLFVSEDRVNNKLKEKRPEMLGNLLGKMKEDLKTPTQEMKALSDGIIKDLNAILSERVDKVAMLLN